MSDNVYTYVKKEAEMSVLNPPDTDFQRGYLAAILVLAEEVLGLRMDMPPFAKALKMCRSATGRMSRMQREIAWCLREMEDLMEEVRS